MREERSLEKRFGSDDWEREGLACIIFSIPCDNVDTSEARYAVHCAGSEKSYGPYGKGESVFRRFSSV